MLFFVVIVGVQWSGQAVGTNGSLLPMARLTAGISQITYKKGDITTNYEFEATNEKTSYFVVFASKCMVFTRKYDRL